MHVIAYQILVKGIAIPSLFPKQMIIKAMPKILIMHSSAILPREQAYMQARRKTINDLLREGCRRENFRFIENKDILLQRHIRSDGVHLNKAGTYRLVKNFVSALNSNSDDVEGIYCDNSVGDDLSVRELSARIN